MASTSFFDDEDDQDQQEESFFSSNPVTHQALPLARPITAADTTDSAAIAGPSRLSKSNLRTARPSTTTSRHSPTSASYDLTSQDVLLADITTTEDLSWQGNVVQRLSQAWKNERACPELLPADANGELESCLQMMLRQSDAVNDLRTDIANWDEVEHLRLLLVQQDIERLRWLVNSLMRCRLSKIEDQYLVLLRDDKYRQRCSLEESQYLERYEALRANCTQSLVLDLFPKKQRSVTEPEMIVEPDQDAAVYVHVMRPVDPITLPDGNPLDLNVHSIHMLRYRSVKHLIASGHIRLI